MTDLFYGDLIMTGYDIWTTLLTGLIVLLLGDNTVTTPGLYPVGDAWLTTIHFLAKGDKLGLTVTISDG